jgi:hypothetical protein
MNDTPAPGAASEEAPAAPPPPRRHWWWRWKLWLAILVFAPILGFMLYTLGTLKWTYSQGIRAGYLQKFSRKGWVCKTWEGELAQTNYPGAAPVIWLFTVRSDAAARQLNLALGRRVLLFYREHRGIPSRCFGDTNFFIDSVRIVQ